MRSAARAEPKPPAEAGRYDHQLNNRMGRGFAPAPVEVVMRLTAHARRTRTRTIAGTALLAAALGVGCATNPATGERQLALVSEAQEIQMGREAAASVRETLGFVDDQQLQTYVQGIGTREAALSERPGLPWEFHVVDDPTPNAFALPGGFIYVTRGMMNLMNSEAELAGVLGHEIGHVTARHSVSQISKQQLAQLGLGLGSIFFPDTQPIQSLVGAGLNLLFLKYSRDDERQADELGFEYMRKSGYAVAEFDDVFEALKRTEAESQQSALPGWLSTHPAPADRVKEAQARAAAVGPQPDARIGQDAYLNRIDNLVYGQDPRDGFFRDGTFYHPKLRFKVSFPRGWQTQNLTQAVVAVAPDNRAAMQLTLVGDRAPDVALRQFLSQGGIAPGRAVRDTINGEPAALAEFQAQTEQGVVQGLVAFIARPGGSYQLVGYTPAQLYSAFAQVMEQSIRSFAAENDPSITGVQPQRIDIVQLQNTLTVSEFARRFDSAVPARTLAILNQVPSEQSQLSRGTLVKRVVG
jgi:predicted Zn-dependent protease